MNTRNVMYCCMTVLVLGGLLLINVSTNAADKALPALGTATAQAPLPECESCDGPSTMPGMYPDEHPGEFMDDDGEHEWEAYEGDPEIQMLMEQIHLMDGFMQTIEAYTIMSEKPEASAIAAIFAAESYFEDWKEYETFLSELLPKVDSPIVKRALRLKLSEICNDPENPEAREKGLAHIRALIVGQE